MLALPHHLRLVALSGALTLVACGGGGGGSDAMNTQPAPSLPPVVNDPQPEPVPPPVALKGTLSVLAGSLGGAGNLDGAGTAARFNYPSGLAVGPAGDLYVADTLNRRIRKVTPAGVVSTVAGSGQLGYADGPAVQASFCTPTSVAVGPDGSVFVVDSPTVRKIDPAGNVRTLAGATTSVCDRRGPFIGGVAPKSPIAVAVDALGVAYITDAFAHAVYTLTPSGTLSVLAENIDPFTNPIFSGYQGPVGIALDANRNVFVTGSQPNVGLGSRNILRITQTGEITTVLPASAALGAMGGLASDAAGNLYGVDSVLRVVRKVTPAGNISIIAGLDDYYEPGGRIRGSVDGPLGTGRLAAPQGVAVAADGTVYVSDAESDPEAYTIRRIDATTGVLSTLAGRVPRGPFFGPHATDRAGNVFVAVPVLDSANGQIRQYAVLRITPDGTATTLVPGGLYGPRGMAVDGAGNLFVADARGCYPGVVFCATTPTVVRKITPQGEMSVFAGQSEGAGTLPRPDIDGIGNAASLNGIQGMTIDPVGNLYLAQYYGAPLRKITPEGVVSTIAVTLPGTEQFLNAVAADAAGNIFLTSCARPKMSEREPPNAAIFKVDPSGNLTQLAGSLTEVGYVDGPGTQARFAAIRGSTFGVGAVCPSGLTLDTAGNLYVADTGNHVVRKITPQGVVSTVVGQRGVRGIAPGSLPASLQQPRGVSFDGAGNLYVLSAYGLVKVQFHQ